MLHVREIVNWPYEAFRDRQDAGQQLADYLVAQGAQTPDVVVAIPSGGVVVGSQLADRFGRPLDMVLVRKLPFPSAPEMGFGAVTLQRQVILDDSLVRMGGLSPEEIERIVERVWQGLKERDRRLMEGRQHAPLEGKAVLLVDDGLATGSTTRAAIADLRARNPASIVLAVPDSPLDTLRSLSPLVDDLYCLVAQRGGSFAVASLYERWHDMSDREVVDILRRRKKPAP